MFGACDEIKQPYTRLQDNNNDSVTETVYRRTLIEVFTGHKCVNCVGAHQEVAALLEDYPGEVIALSIHAGYFAKPSSSGDYTTDYRCNAGEELSAFFEVTSNPIGMINRESIGGSYLLNENSWRSEVARRIRVYPAEMDIAIESEYQAFSRALTVTTTLRFLTAVEKSLRIVVSLAEDHLISAQKNNVENLGPTPDIFDYEHNHVLRDAINGTWGTPLSPQPVVAAAGDSLKMTFSGYIIPNDWNPNNLSIVAWVYAGEEPEILQVAHKSLLK
jgi:hypothetical protein